ncbi:MAG: HAMP domain-containing sensor histidine kinase [Chitinophagales bacterium]|nr:HAMP domain-containing histidine kinase [Chitinophagales bacterium]MDW8393777.1 HAMP domain-containing sensor histidine kinase [Chitinophagales bacterium]
MSNRTLRIITLLALLSIGGIIVLQVRWFRHAFDVKEKQLDQTIFTALQTVGEHLLAVNQQQIPNTSLVSQMSSNYFAVNVNGEIDTRLLESLLITEFRNRSILQDFEYGVYDCNHQKLVYGNYVSLTDPNPPPTPRELPQWKNDLYYFTVHFPRKKQYLFGTMDVWLFSSSVLLFVVAFFSFSMMAIFRQKRLSEVQRDFINNMTHELKTPVSSILVATQLLRKTQPASNHAGDADYVSLIHQQALRLSGLVEQILQAALWDERRMPLKKDTVDVHQCIQEAVTAVKPLLQEKKGTVRLQLGADPSTLTGDALHLTHVFYNLLENAVKYNHEQPAITITTSLNGKSFLATVEDNGIGIAPEHARRIFERFYRVHTGDVHDVKGFGLGLYYAKKVITAHGGKIFLDPTTKPGSRFTIQLPLR